MQDKTLGLYTFQNENEKQNIFNNFFSCKQFATKNVNHKLFVINLKVILYFNPHFNFFKLYFNKQVSD